MLSELQATENLTEIPVIFACQGQNLHGIIHQADISAALGVLMIVGGPQYRVGSHRQFVLLARHLAAQGIPVMRFDVRGMGDSQGQPHNFGQIDDDIRAASDYFFASCPALSQVVLWGLCDGASAALFYAYQDQRVKGMVLLNPWVFTEQGSAKTYLRHYYLQRFFSKDFWLKVLSLKFNYASSVLSLWRIVKQAASKSATPESQHKVTKVDEHLALPTRMRECLKQFEYPVLLILSGRDLTADEFKETVKADPEWQSLLSNPRVFRRDFAEADHTFSSAAWRDQVAEWSSDWVKKLS
ncbi:MAG: hydrolase 1, exosortase A system-associated [Methylovulum sp.]|uniref:hydrolase 1, exosortase A system-associated n=1 Tax=Methylovulum sp. TaxID=1916980 RepID=UPI00263A12F8|nr:hydrolase 1, exosortase A system-associated [Methylovulum sp.]MDD2725081.1 hydrolase 1, exosortase A system-associated [Methylovulum sp.]MDD5124130.1 hydrolase 1, exosortase A system-associated [Methylovulum sp.]